MPRISALIFSIFIAAACSPQPDDTVRNHTWEEVEQMGGGTITLYYVPSDGFSYTDDIGRLTGVTIELVRDFVDFVNVEHDMNLTIHYEPVEQFSTFYSTVRDASGGVFGVANVTITEERREELAFSPPYMTNIATLITHSDVSEINSFEEIPGAFEGLSALAFEGTLHQQRLEAIVENYLPEAHMEFAQSNNEIINRTSESNRYFAYVDIYNYWRAAQAGAPLQRHSAGDEASEQFGVIMPHDSDWAPLMDQFFNEGGGYVQSERYRNLMANHLGEELANLLLAQED
jgi:ABC-type amino acid transport substrate-binding protein